MHAPQVASPVLASLLGPTGAGPTLSGRGWGMPLALARPRTPRSCCAPWRAVH